MPSSSFVVFGIVYNSKGVNSPSSLVTFKISEIKTVTSDSKGRYVIDLSDISSSDGATVTYTAHDEFDNETYSGSFVISGGMKEIDINLSVRTDKNVVYGNRDTQIFNIGGKPVSISNPFPVESQGLPDNYESEWTITRTDGQPDAETITIGEKNFKRTFSYTNNILTKRTKWVKQY